MYTRRGENDIIKQGPKYLANCCSSYGVRGCDVSRGEDSAARALYAT